LAEACGGWVWLVPHTRKEDFDEEADDDSTVSAPSTEQAIDPHYSIFVVRFPVLQNWPDVVKGL
jgi:hypothetical protein